MFVLLLKEEGCVHKINMHRCKYAGEAVPGSADQQGSANHASANLTHNSVLASHLSAPSGHYFIISQ